MPPARKSAASRFADVPDAAKRDVLEREIQRLRTDQYAAQVHASSLEATGANPDDVDAARQRVEKFEEVIAGHQAELDKLADKAED